MPASRADRRAAPARWVSASRSPSSSPPRRLRPLAGRDSRRRRRRHAGASRSRRCGARCSWRSSSGRVRGSRYRDRVAVVAHRRPARRLWRVLAPLPLVFPSFVGAAAFLAGLAPDGAFGSLLDWSATTPPDGSAASAPRGWCSRCSRIPTCTCRSRPAWRRCRRRSRRAPGCSVTGLGARSAGSCCPSIRRSILGGMLLVVPLQPQ